MKRTCKDCGKDFEINSSEIKFYKSKNLALPKRCSDCRKNKKNNNYDKDKKEDKKEEQREETVQSSSVNSGSTTASGNKKDSKVKKIVAAVAVVAALATGGELLSNQDAANQNVNNTNAPAVTMESSETNSQQEVSVEKKDYVFKNERLLKQHFEKHGEDFDYETMEEYEKHASDVINSDKALTKTEKEDGDYVFYIEETNEFVILSTDGYIRTYFKPSGGINYFNRQ